MKILSRDFEQGQMARDMNLFVDDQWDSLPSVFLKENSTLHISQLSDDFLTVSGKYARFFPNRYMEAPTIFKTNDGNYYFIGSDCTGWLRCRKVCISSQHIGAMDPIGKSMCRERCRTDLSFTKHIYPAFQG